MPMAAAAAADLNPEAAVAHRRVIVVGAGPAGLAVAAGLRRHGIPFFILERGGSIASLWKERTYDSLRLHIATEFCTLPMMPLPAESHRHTRSRFLTRHQFLDYLQAYADFFHLRPRFHESVQSAAFDEASQLWVVQTSSPESVRSGSVNNIYTGRWLVVATGENAEPFLPTFPGLQSFHGTSSHSCQYRNGSPYRGKKVLVIGSGNSGMEIASDLCNHGARTSLVVRSPMHILPIEVFGKSTFSVGMQLIKSFPVWLVDRFLVYYSRVVLGDTLIHGIPRPKVGPLELKAKMGKTPVLDVGTLSKIKSGDIKVMPAVECFTKKGVQFVSGVHEDFDAVIFATGYKSNVLRWLKDKDQFFGPDSMPRTSCPYNWKGAKGLYVAGLCRKGVFGAASDAILIVDDICRAFNKPRSNH